MSNYTKKPPVVKVLVTADVHCEVKQNYDVVDGATSNADTKSSTNHNKFAKSGNLSYIATKLS